MMFSSFTRASLRHSGNNSDTNSLLAYSNDNKKLRSEQDGRERKWAKRSKSECPLSRKLCATKNVGLWAGPRIEPGPAHQPGLTGPSPRGEISCGIRLKYAHLGNIFMKRVVFPRAGQPGLGRAEAKVSPSPSPAGLTSPG